MSGPGAQYRRPTRRLAALLSLAFGASLVSACTDDPPDSTLGAVTTGAWQLVAYESCQDAIESLREAAKSVVGPYGFGYGPGIALEDLGGGAVPPALPDSAAAEGSSSLGEARQEKAAGTDFSGTNTHESGVDEPDIVKTDGRRIVTISGGTLRVTDATTMTVSSFLDLEAAAGDSVRYAPTDLLLYGDHALVLLQSLNMGPARMVDGPLIDGPMVDGFAPVDTGRFVGMRLLLVDLAGTPRVLSALTVDGALVDARQVGSVARVVVRSGPRLKFPVEPSGTDDERIERNRTAIDEAELADWLPRIAVSTGGRTEPTEIGCSDVSRPDSYTGTNMLTILTVDVGGANLQQTSPSVLVADGDTVYSNGSSLYVASDQRWRVAWPGGREAAGRPEPALDPRTEIYKFDTSGPGRPAFVAGGAVPGYLLNQYSMSEWDGHLRVATTTEGDWLMLDRGPADEAVQRETGPESGVHVLAHRGGSLVEVGSVTGLGKGERIYAVRFTGAIGYVVTFRQTDPLYTVDLSDPNRPVVRGELKIPGYSAYLHPAGPDRLIGIGQDATGTGRITGTQVSLFDVGDLARPERLAQYHLTGAHSEAEFDPHAFLYWPAEALLVVPVQAPDGVGVDRRRAALGGALVLRVGGAGISEIGFLQHPESGLVDTHRMAIRRSLVIGQTLWTMSDAGLMANDIRTLTRLAWVPFT